MNRLLLICALGTTLAPLAGCDRPTGGADSKPRTGGEAAPPPSNRIDLPAAVRQNLGITFARVERRRVASTIRVPGRFELLPSARREYRASLAGSVRLLVSQYEEIGKGKPIIRMDSPEWHTLKRELHEAEAGIE